MQKFRPSNWRPLRQRDVCVWAYHRAWGGLIPFVVIAIVAVACLRGVKELMTERVEATVENVSSDEEKRAISNAPAA